VADACSYRLTGCRRTGALECFASAAGEAGGPICRVGTEIRRSTRRAETGVRTGGARAEKMEKPGHSEE
jgi:hypothetical protein